MRTEAFVHACDAEATVADVVRAIARSGAVQRIVVVDTGSTDSTASFAAASGAAVVRSTHGDRPQAIRDVVARSLAGTACFFDAALVGLTPEHVRMIALPVAEGRASMVCGLHDHGPYNKMQEFVPIVTTDRAVLREVLDGVPSQFWSGHKLEICLNELASRHRLPAHSVVMHGTRMPAWRQAGLMVVVEDAAKMVVDVLEATRDAQALPR